MTIKIGQPDEVREASYVVCLPVTAATPWRATNVCGVCVLCGQPVQHRPDVPPGIPLACVPCFEQMHQPSDTLLVTPRTLDELLNLGRNN